MEASSATVLAAAISGVLAIISGYVATAGAHRGFERERAERGQDRQHALLTQLMPRQLASLETLWWRTFQCELEQQLSEENQVGLVRASLWMPDALRTAVLDFVGATSLGLPFDEGITQRLGAVRRLTLEFTRVHKVERFFETHGGTENG